jgi:SAM-dependent methyltransferase
VAAPANWYTTFFSGSASRSIPRMYPPELTRSQADFLVKALKLSPGARVLDVPCGAGRLALELASRGFRAQGVDLAADLVEIARREAGERNLDADFRTADMRDLARDSSFDGAFCFGNSFGYLEDAGNAEFLRAAAGALRPGARLVLEVPLILETLSLVLIERSWHRLGDLLLLRAGSYDPERGRADVEYTFIEGATTEVKEASYRVYGYRELAQLVREAGFGSVEGWGSLAGEPFKLGAKCLYLIATRS